MPNVIARAGASRILASLLRFFVIAFPLSYYLVSLNI